MQYRKATNSTIFASTSTNTEPYVGQRIPGLLREDFFVRVFLLEAAASAVFPAVFRQQIFQYIDKCIFGTFLFRIDIHSSVPPGSAPKYAQICKMQIWAKFVFDDFTILKENSTKGGTHDGKIFPTPHQRSFWELSSKKIKISRAKNEKSTILVV